MFRLTSCLAAAAVVLVAVGFADAEVVFQRLGYLPGGNDDSYAWSVSAEGSVVVGRSDSPSDQSFRWTEATGMVGLGWMSPGDGSNEAHGVSADGSVIVGTGGGQWGPAAL